MKLWWPHCETLIAYAMLYQQDHQEIHWQRFIQTAEYTFKHFSAMISGGEWFGYLDREGRATHRFKGGPYKGCFHVPRALFFVFEILDSMK
jgi:N-acylglucosamine 2-epimerase